MHVSRLRIENFRSIRSLDLTFKRGKNVIVGRNNAGKSNIVRAMDLVLGESSPTWAKSDNIGENDFFCFKEDSDGEERLVRANHLLIWCELERMEGENLNFAEINRCTGLKLYGGDRGSRTPAQFPADRLEAQPDGIFTINEDSAGFVWVDSKLRNQETFERWLQNKHHFAFVFRASRNEDGSIEKDMRFAFRENADSDWLVAFRPSIRNELLQSDHSIVQGSVLATSHKRLVLVRQASAAPG
ncbi:MAG TPA: AAA family ATPase [Thermoanaerobaculia bacterium]